MKNRFKKINQLIVRMEKTDKKKFAWLCAQAFISCIFVGLFVGCLIKLVKIYRLKQEAKKVEIKMKDRLTKKLERFQLNIK